MRRILFILTLVSVLGMTGCVGNVQKSGGNQADDSDSSRLSTEELTGAFSEEDLIFVLDGVEYPLNSDAAPLILAFGEDYELTSAPSCAYIGEDKWFDYSFGSVSTYPMDDKDLIDEIYFYDGDYTTRRGIGIGSTLADVKEKYGEDGFEQDDMWVYVLSGDINDLQSPKLYFELSDDVVSGISYYAASNVQ